MPLYQPHQRMSQLPVHWQVDQIIMIHMDFHTDLSPLISMPPYVNTTLHSDPHNISSLLQTSLKNIYQACLTYIYQARQGTLHRQLATLDLIKFPQGLLFLLHSLFPCSSVPPRIKGSI